MKRKIFRSQLFLAFCLLLLNPALAHDTMLPSDLSFGTGGLLIILGILIFALLIVTLLLNNDAEDLMKAYKRRKDNGSQKLTPYLNEFSGKQLEKLLQFKKNNSVKTKTFLLFIFSSLFSNIALAQTPNKPDGGSLFGEAGIIIMLVLLAIPILAGVLILFMQVRNVIAREKDKLKIKEAENLAEYLDVLTDDELKQLEQRKNALSYSLSDNEHSGKELPNDKRGLLQYSELEVPLVVALKRKALPRPNVDPELSKIILWFICTATFWLLFGTSVGEYLGIKFIAPDIDQSSWLSFGRLRPVHTNAVFWGWASLGMVGLGYYVVPRVSNAPLANKKWAWYSLYLINAAILLGSISLMAGINNSGGEYREYIWPIMMLFAGGLVFTLRNFIKTIANRKTEEIYISNWYIVSALIFISIVALAGYLPFWQDGLGETIMQGYYMHQAVGMWFMFFTLGIVYYFLPQQLNRPIYSYSLGVLAFWSQILFYTLVGTHHFIFSAIPWWLQTVAIVASVGMVIPVTAGATNFLMTFKGASYKLWDSYTLPFFLVGIIFYFTGSMQGTVQAFRFTSLLWHFTDFNVAHSHITMYGIITFLLWAGIYAVVPRLTGKEAPKIAIGAHFWFALIGLMFYTIPLMYGGTLRGLAWMNGEPFVETVSLMMPYWLWRAIGGTLMWLSHIVFAYNLYKMVKPVTAPINVGEVVIQKLEKQA